MASSERPTAIRVADHQEDKVLRLQTPESYATDAATMLLKFLESELDAEIGGRGWRSRYGVNVAEPVTVRLEALDVELSTDGSEIELWRVGGSKGEFDELCALIIAE